MQSSKSAKKLRALVVDDAPDIAVMLDVMLRQAGYDPLMATCAADAILLAKRVQFDVVISDIAMPGMDGYSLIQSLRTLPEYSHVPMLSITGFTQYDDPVRSHEAGFDAHMEKPIQPKRLIAVIEDIRRRGH